MNVSGEKGEFKAEYVLYYKLMVLFPNYQSAERVYEETGEVLGFIENSGKKRPHDYRNKYNEAFIEFISSIIEKYRDKVTNRVYFLQTNNPYNLVERLERKPDLRS